jgi:type VI secretion system protein ImpB
MASRESTQKKLGRIRPPRVHITYDVETGGAIEKRELPFVVGVFADLSGMPDKPLPKYKDRKFIEIDRDNVDQVMAKQTPRIAFKVDNTLKNDESKLGVELRFKKMADFEPQNVVQQVDPLRQLMELRQKLSNLRSSLYGNDKLEELLQEAVRNTEALQGLSSEKGPADSESGQSKKE